MIPRPFGRRWLLWQARRPYVRDWEGRPLLVLPGVLDPVATKVGAWLADTAARAVVPGESWCDMGCGTGIVGLALAAAGARVTSVDIDPEAVRNARANAALHRLDVTVIESDLFTAVPGRFDRVVYNVPFWPGDPRVPGKPRTNPGSQRGAPDEVGGESRISGFGRRVFGGEWGETDAQRGVFGRAMYAGEDFEAIRSFVAAFPAHATEAWVVLSEFGGDFAGARAALGPSEVIRREKVRGEWLSLFRL